jgi:hypothetical protein
VTRARIAGALLALVALAAVAAGLAWSQRTAIAEAWLRDRVAALGIAESALRVAALDLRGIAIESVSLGAADAPDLTVERVEADWTRSSLTAGRFTALRVRGLRLRATHGDAGLSLGALDPIWKSPDSETASALVLPAPEIALDDAQVEVATPQGVARGSLGGALRETADGIDGTFTLDLSGGGLEARGEMKLGGTLALPSFDLRLDARGKGRDAIGLALTGRRDGDDVIWIESGTLHAAGAKLTVAGARIDPRGLVLERGRVEVAIASGVVSATIGGAITLDSDRLGGTLAIDVAGPDLTARGTLALSGSFERPSARIRLDPLAWAGESLRLDGLVRLEKGGAIAIEKATLDLLGGTLAIDRALVDPGATRIVIPMRVARVDLAGLLARAAVEGLAGSGTLGGELPLLYERGVLRIDSGRLRAEEGGTLRYAPSASVQNLAESRPADLGIAVRAFSDFRYEVLEARVDGDVDGALSIGLHVRGTNPSFEDGRAVELNLNLESRLADLVRAGSAAYGVPGRIEERLRKSAEGNR